jgi:hypothetical protein
MKARCTYCGLFWGISVRQKIPRTGYECPGVQVEEKENASRVLQHK